MSPTEYRSSHPLAWTIIAGVIVAGVAGIGAAQGWLPVPGRPAAELACAECGVVESVRTVEMPIGPFDSAEPSAMPVSDVGTAGTADAAAAGGEPPPVAMVSYSYEITVRHANGSVSVISQLEPPAWKAGDRVRVIEGTSLVAG